jgi:aryl-phospho-beta-D-glucosidase BglC (GH1 family)
VPPPPIQIKGNKLTAAGKPLEIHGLNWFGFNVPMGVVDGLWAGGTDLASDFGKIAYQLRLLGYNAVRLPYTHRNLLNEVVSDVVRECAPTTVDDLKKRVTDPNKFSVAQTKQIPGNVSPLFNKQEGYCNTHLPGTNNMDRFLFVIQQFIAQGLYVVLDYQPMGTEDYAYNLDKFVTQWALVWKKVSCLPNWGPDIAGRVFVDVMNEPDSMGIRWEANNDRPGAQQLYLATSDALWRISPNQVMFMYEGTGQNMMGLSWGNGFVTDQSIIQSRGLSDANGFFQRLVTRPYAKQVGGVLLVAASIFGQMHCCAGYISNAGLRSAWQLPC